MLIWVPLYSHNDTPQLPSAIPHPPEERRMTGFTTGLFHCIVIHPTTKLLDRSSVTLKVTLAVVDIEMYNK